MSVPSEPALAFESRGCTAGRRRLGMQPIQQQEQHGRHCDEHRHGQGHPGRKADVDADGVANHADADQVRRRADGCADAADARGIGNHQHHAGREWPRACTERAAVAACAVQRGENAESDRHHHGRRRRVAHPHRDDGRDEAEPREHARGRSADPRYREERQRDAPVEPVNRHRARQHEAADEEEHDRVGEVGEHLPGRRHAERDAEDGAEQRRDRQRQRLADPQHDHCGKDRRHHLALRPEASAGQVNGRECQRREHDAGCAPAALECGFERGDRLGRLPMVAMQQVRLPNLSRLATPSCATTADRRRGSSHSGCRSSAGRRSSRARRCPSARTRDRARRRDDNRRGLERRLAHRLELRLRFSRAVRPRWCEPSDVVAVDLGRRQIACAVQIATGGGPRDLAVLCGGSRERRDGRARRHAARCAAHGASIPCACLMLRSAGDPKKDKSARAASGCVELSATPPEKVVSIWMSGGSGPRTSMPSPPSSLSC